MMTSTSPPSSNRSSLPVDPWKVGTGPALTATVHTGPFRCEVRSTSVADGDFAVSGERPALEARRQKLVAHPWTWLRQTHSTRIVTASYAGQEAGADADGVTTAEPWVPIAVTTADCSPVVLVGTTAVAVVHAGWRGAADGIVEEAAAVLAEHGAEPVATLLGPCIGPLDYAFGSDDLSSIAERYGPAVRATTRHGDEALNMEALISAAAQRGGWPDPAPAGCTSDTSYFSHRTRGDKGRQTTVAWLEPVLRGDVGHG